MVHRHSDVHAAGHVLILGHGTPGGDYTRMVRGRRGRVDAQRLFHAGAQVQVVEGANSVAIFVLGEGWPRYRR